MRAHRIAGRPRPALAPATFALVMLLRLAGEAAAYTAIDFDGGTVSGVVRFESEFPDREEIRADRDVATCGSSYLSEQFVVDPESKGLKSAVAILVDVQAGKPFPEGVEPELNQEGCRFVPHVQYGFFRGRNRSSDGAGSAGGGRKGTQLIVINSDDVLHNVHGFDERDRTAFNVASVPATTITNLIRRPGIYEVKCDVHSWMSAWIVIVDHPYVAMSDPSGHFVIEDVPPGEHTIRIWHEGLGETTRDVHVISGETSFVELVVGGADP